MALVRDFEVPNTGLTIPNSYHIISDVKLDKRTYSIPVGANSKDPLNGEPGYIGQIFIHVFASKESRDQGMKPIAFINAAMPEFNDINFRFAYDPDSVDTLLTQAYDHLKQTNFYKDSVEA